MKVPVHEQIGISIEDRRVLERLGRKLSRVLDEHLKGTRFRGSEDIGYTLLLFTYGEDPGFATHLSTAGREHLVPLLREYADVIEKRRSERPLL